MICTLCKQTCSLRCVSCREPYCYRHAYIEQHDTEPAPSFTAVCVGCDEAASLDGMPCSTPGCTHDAEVIVSRGELCAKCANDNDQQRGFIPLYGKRGMATIGETSQGWEVRRGGTTLVVEDTFHRAVIAYEALVLGDEG